MESQEPQRHNEEITLDRPPQPESTVANDSSGAERLTSENSQPLHSMLNVNGNDTDPENRLNQPLVNQDRQEEPPHEQEKKPTGLLGLVREVVELVVVTLFLLIAIRWTFAEARYIPSSSMEPTLQIEDRLLVEKVSGHLGKPIRRGDILVFYPPPSEMPNGQDLSSDPLFVMGRLTGLPFLPYEPAFIKRVIGLPGDKIRVQRGVGVFINEQLLDEPYIKERPNYDLNVLADIGGRSSTGNQHPYGDSTEPIMVPAGQLFMMGDNRNNSEDSHVWGFLDQRRVIGRACLLFWRWLEPTKYRHSIEGSE